MALFLFALAAILVLMLISGGYVFFAGCYRRRENPWFDAEALKSTPYGKFSEHIVAAKQWLDVNGAQQVSILNRDGLNLRGLWVPAENPKGTMLLVHGYRSCVLVDFGLVLDYYHKLGMNLLLPDQRSHGKSEGRFITFGVKESGDILEWLHFHNHTFGNYPVILSGLSMGASTVLYLADKQLPDNVKGIIADCGFTSPKAIISSVFTGVTHFPAVPTIWFTDLFARVFAHFSLSEMDTRVTLAGNRLPIIMVHGTEDTFVPCEMTKEGFTVCTGPKQLLLVDGAGHVVSYLHDRERYTNLVEAFLKSYIDGI